jgi:hypothetical protein
MLYSEMIAVCFEIHTKTHKYTVWAEHSAYVVYKETTGLYKFKAVNRRLNAYGLNLMLFKDPVRTAQ